MRDLLGSGTSLTAPIIHEKMDNAKAIACG
jgi:hypothetical protein